MPDNYPYNDEIERAVLGALLINPGMLPEANLSEMDFYIHRNRYVYQAIVELHDKKTAIDLITIGDCLTRKGKFADVGGASGITALLTGTPMSSMHVADYAKLLRRYAVRREMINQAQALALAAMKDDADPMAAIEKSIDTLSKTSLGSDAGAGHFADYISRVYDLVVEAMSNPKDVYGLSTGLADVDMLLGGLHPGDLIYIAGKPGAGKSKLALSMAVGLAKAGHPGAMYSLEMSGDFVAYRALSAEAKISTRALKSGKINDDQFAQFCGAVDNLSVLPLFFSDRQIDIPSLRTDLYRLKYTHGLQWFCVDYLKLLSGFENVGNETERSTRLSQSLKRLAMALEVPAIVLNSMNKDGQREDMPSVTGMSGSGQVIHDADVIIMVSSSEASPNEVKCNFTKTRDVSGGNLSVKLYAAQGYPLVGNAETVKL